MVFATDKQLQLLKSAKTWYVDATSNVVKKPFTQLYTIHEWRDQAGTFGFCHDVRKKESRLQESNEEN